MADNNENNNDKHNDNDSNAEQPRGFVSGILDFISTPLRTRTRNDRQDLIDHQQQQHQDSRQQELLDLEADIGIESSVAALVCETIPQVQEEKEKEEEEEEETTIMVTTTYSLGGMSIDFLILMNQYKTLTMRSVWSSQK
jgi:hypothetical protein